MCSLCAFLAGVCFCLFGCSILPGNCCGCAHAHSLTPHADTLLRAPHRCSPAVAACWRARLSGVHAGHVRGWRTLCYGMITVLATHHTAVQHVAVDATAAAPKQMSNRPQAHAVRVRLSCVLCACRACLRLAHTLTIGMVTILATHHTCGQPVAACCADSTKL